MKFSDVMIHFDYKMFKIAAAVGVSRNSVSTWKKLNHIPYTRQCQLEIVTKGVLKAEKERQ
jgi:DNA-binding transcriptional regulator Cro